MYQEIQCTNIKHIIIAFYFSIFSSYPILLQGPTSSGKTSLIQYLGKVTGHKCIRINNHEHTDLQEYIGMYTTGTDGTLSFHEGQCIYL